jgi:hypothetical protein
VRKAGFNETNFPKLREIKFVTEPEAAAMFTARYFKEEKKDHILRVGT